MSSPRLALVVLASALALAARTAPALEVVAVTTQVSPASSSGPCPVTFKFTGKVGLSKEGRFTYRWERSDRAVDTTPHAPVVYDGAHAAIATIEWKLGARSPAFHPYHGWMKLHVLTPQDRLSEPANFTLDCGAPPPTLPPGAVGRPAVPGTPSTRGR